jgi:hypothetical protein
MAGQGGRGALQAGRAGPGEVSEGHGLGRRSGQAKAGRQRRAAVTAGARPRMDFIEVRLAVAVQVNQPDRGGLVPRLWPRRGTEHNKGQRTRR